MSGETPTHEEEGAQQQLNYYDRLKSTGKKSNGHDLEKYLGKKVRVVGLGIDHNKNTVVEANATVTIIDEYRYVTRDQAILQLKYKTEDGKEGWADCWHFDLKGIA